MPTVFSHAIAATALGQWFPQRRLPARFWIWTVACAVLPDIDVVGFSLGIPYDDMLGHRGLTHSIPFALVVGLVAARSFAKSDSLGVGSWRLGVLWVYFAAIAASHGLLDAFTNGGRGIAFFAPFSNQRFFFPWRPIQVSPIGVGFFSARGLAVLQSELRWILLPSAIITLIARIAVKPARRRSRAPASEGG
jgi:inner membrane protein